MTKKRLLHKYLLWCCLLALVPAVLFFVFREEEGKTELYSEQVTKGNILVSVKASGKVTAARLITVGAQASGQIEKLHVRLGQSVQEGDMIAEIDSTAQVNELKTRQARLQTYRAQLASRNISLAVAETQFKREEHLRKQNATTKENLENAENTFGKAKADVAEMQSLVSQEEIAVQTAEANLGYTRITAPVSGVIISIPVEAGQTVNANQTTPTIVQLADLTKMEIKVLISEGDITKVAADMPVTYYILSDPGVVYTTTLDFIDPASTDYADASSQSSLSSSSNEAAVYYYGRILVDNTEGKLRIGMTTQNTILVAEAIQVLRVPTYAIHRERGGTFVYIVDRNQSISRRDVVCGLSDTLYTQILEGVQEGEEVVTAQMTAAEIQLKMSRRRGWM